MNNIPTTGELFATNQEAALADPLVVVYSMVKNTTGVT
tara:strand:- start:407 stop:520 length:114 start_codon:yes stop_codon:yes gene_type:complete